jgi:UDP-N-acetylmuramate dehydrogenase
MGLRNTLGVPAYASLVRRITSADELEHARREAQAQGQRPVVLGGASNVVLAERIEAPVFLIRNRGIQVQRNSDSVDVTIAAGERWHDLVRWSLGQGFSGLENLALIPGDVGAAPVQNIGAYGAELADSFLGADVVEMETGKRLRMGREEMSFGYRTSLLKGAPGAFVILSITLRLQADGQSVNDRYPDVKEELDRMGRSRTTRPVDVAEAVVRVRRRKLPDPRFVPNAGSFFKNPVTTEEDLRGLERKHGSLKRYPDPGGVKLAAAELIDHCRRISDGPVAWAQPDAPVRVWHRQPLVLTNPGRRSAAEVLEVAGQIRQAVELRFGVRLQMEPDLIAG